ncbi:Uncharacterised protein [Mycobacterium tuberculosis]|nr:Uncharacterised protein [Mycobacterium tuberculosis]
MRHRRRDMQPGGQRVRRELFPNRRDRVPVHRRTPVQPRGPRRAGGDRPRAGGLRVTRDIRPAWTGCQCEYRHFCVGQQHRYRTMQCRPAQHDHLLRAQQRQRQRVQRVVPGPRRRRFCDGRQRREVGVHASAMPGDDHGVDRQVDVQWLVEGDRRRVGPRLASRPARRGDRAEGLGIGHQRFAQRDVEVHGARVGGASTRGGRPHSARSRSPGRVERRGPLGCVLGQPQADAGAHLGAEIAQLFHGLVGAGAQQLVGPIG